MNQLYGLFKQAQQGDEFSICYIIEKFKPLIRKYANQLSYDCAETDLVISVLELLKKLNLEELKNCSDGALVNYIARYLTSKKIDIHRKLIASRIEECHIDPETIQIKSKDMKIEDQVCWNSLLLSLPVKYREVLIKRYIIGYSITEIGAQMGLSRQSVNKINNRALSILKEKID